MGAKDTAMAVVPAVASLILAHDKYYCVFLDLREERILLAPLESYYRTMLHKHLFIKLSHKQSLIWPSVFQNHFFFNLGINIYISHTMQLHLILNNQFQYKCV